MKIKSVLKFMKTEATTMKSVLALMKTKIMTMETPK
ncbi:hypothetical protein PC123_g19203 [Phytophthora cactorum]|nr:hypothetical protein PC123_g19203 [Phytophthora cactorum]